MIAFLNGIIEFIDMDHCIINVNNVGYKVYLPVSTRDEIGMIGSTVKLYTYMNVREDAMELYGFKTTEELEFFKILLSVSGIGPRGGLKILSSISATEFKRAIREENLSVLTSISGVGKKTAQRLILELKEKVGTYPLPELTGDGRVMGGTELEADACAALIALGYTHSEVSETIRYVKKELGDKLEKLDPSSLIQYMLKVISAHK